MLRLLMLGGLAYAGYRAYNNMSPEKRQQLLDKSKDLMGKLPLDRVTRSLGKVGL